MKIRIWRTDVDQARLAEYEAFAREVSLPMFRSQKGFLGVLMGGSASRQCVITCWESAEAIAQLDRSEGYKATVARIMAAGFLAGEQTVEVYDGHLAHVSLP